VIYVQKSCVQMESKVQQGGRRSTRGTQGHGLYIFNYEGASMEVLSFLRGRDPV